MRLAGKRALLTAAGAGIGRATALAFAKEGCTVIATDVDASALDALSHDMPSGAHYETFALDARDLASVRSGVARAGDIDILYNCAGWVHHGTILETSEEEWDFSFDLNVKSMWRTLTCALPGMIARGGGSVVNMASAASSLVGAPNRALYGATKAAVIGLTKAVATDHVAQGIRCNCICPGTVESPSLENRIKAQGKSLGDYDAARAAFVARQPMGRIATADEIAMLALYLASDESSFTTGHAHVIDGGWSNV
ncbi:MAG: SDR family oxidoreductase [Pseudomonadota bacterium]